MENKFVECNGYSICYYEINPDAHHTIFFIHGNSLDKTAWRKQYSDPALSHCRMIVIDLPSHGSSSPINVDDCSLPGIGKLMADVVSLLAKKHQYILAGISLGTNIIAEMLAFDLPASGLLLAGSCLVGLGISVSDIVFPDTHVGVVFTDGASSEDVIAYAKETSLSTKEEDLQIFLSGYNNVAAPFRSLLGASIADGKYSDEFALVQEADIPVLYVFGKNEKVVRPGYMDDLHLHAWRNTIYKLEGASHLVNIDEPVEFNQLMEEFVADVLI